MSRAMDAALAQRPEHAAEARQAGHRTAFEPAWKGLGYPDDPALKRRIFVRALPRIEAGCAQIEARAAPTPPRSR